MHRVCDPIPKTVADIREAWLSTLILDGVVQ
jgi:hypothetical protein